MRNENKSRYAILHIKMYCALSSFKINICIHIFIYSHKCYEYFEV